MHTEIRYCTTYYMYDNHPMMELRPNKLASFILRNYEWSNNVFGDSKAIS